MNEVWISGRLRLSICKQVIVVVVVVLSRLNFSIEIGESSFVVVFVQLGLSRRVCGITALLLINIELLAERTI